MTHDELSVERRRFQAVAALSERHPFAVQCYTRVCGCGDLVLSPPDLPLHAFLAKRLPLSPVNPCWNMCGNVRPNRVI